MRVGELSCALRINMMINMNDGVAFLEAML